MMISNSVSSNKTSEGQKYIFVQNYWSPESKSTALHVQLFFSVLVEWLFLFMHIDSLLGLGLFFRSVCSQVKLGDIMVYYKYLGTLGSVGSCLVLLENEISVFMRLIHWKISWWMSVMRTWY